MSTDSLKKLRIFAASPSDVTAERAKVDTVVGLLKPLADHIGVVLEVKDWRAVVPDMGRPQQIIFDQLQPTLGCIHRHPLAPLWHALWRNGPTDTQKVFVGYRRRISRGVSLVATIQTPAHHDVSLHTSRPY